MNYSIPNISRKFLVIAGRGQQQLTAIISSYIYSTGLYSPIFELPDVTIAKPEKPLAKNDENLPSVTSTEYLVFRIRNVIAKLKGVDHVILAGLSDDLITYIDIPTAMHVVKIEAINNVEAILRPLLNTNKPELACRPDQILIGLYSACNSGMWLCIKEDAPDIDPIRSTNFNGLIVIEDDGSSCAAIAATYSALVNADIAIVKKVEYEQAQNVVDLIIAWKHRRYPDDAAFDLISDMAIQRIGHIDFSTYQFATFFTAGLPYSLVLKNVIPISHVNLQMRPDHLIFNNLFHEESISPSAAVLFSLGEFSSDEITHVKDFFYTMNYYVKVVSKDEATVYNLDKYLQQYPFHYFHICSHGGELSGATIKINYNDRSGNPHSIEYDEFYVISSLPNDKKDRFLVQKQHVMVRLDGESVRSVAFKEKTLSDQWREDAELAIQSAKAADKGVIDSEVHLSGEAAIKCVDGNWLGMLQVISPTEAPLIFNNTCWSGTKMAERFLNAGCRGYIGTLWAVGENTAEASANLFYDVVKRNENIMHALYYARSKAMGQYENIYIYWGLHFATLKPVQSIAQSRIETFKEILHLKSLLERNFPNLPEGFTKEHIIDDINWLTILLKAEMTSEEVKTLHRGYQDEILTAILKKLRKN
jgi:hypothetical protein